MWAIWNMIKGSQLTPDLKDKAVTVIKKYLNEKGFRYATVKVIQKNDTLQKGMVIVDVDVDPGSKVKVHEIFLEGNKALSFNQVVGAMKKTNEPKLVNLFKTKKFVDENFAADKNLIVERYNEKGFRDAVVVWDSVARFDDRSVNVYLKVDEGKKYYIRNISCFGNDAQQILFRLFIGLMQPVTVGGFGNQVIALWKRFGWLNDMVVRTTYIAGICQPDNFISFFDFKVHHRAAQHMSGVGKLYIDAVMAFFVVEIESTIVGHADKEFHTLFGIHADVHS